MREIYQNGPVALNFFAVLDTYQYKSGIYIPFSTQDSMEMQFEKSSRTIGLSSLDKCLPYEWMQLNHAVLCYGWGEIDGIKVR